MVWKVFCQMALSSTHETKSVIQYGIIHLVYTQFFFPKTNISYLWYSHVRTCAYQGVRNVNFSEHLAYAHNEWSIYRVIVLCGGLLLSVQYCISYRNQSFDLHSKSMDWFLYEMQHEWNGLNDEIKAFIKQCYHKFKYWRKFQLVDKIYKNQHSIIQNLSEYLYSESILVHSFQPTLHVLEQPANFSQLSLWTL